MLEHTAVPLARPKTSFKNKIQRFLMKQIQPLCVILPHLHFRHGDVSTRSPCLVLSPLQEAFLGIPVPS